MANWREGRVRTEDGVDLHWQSWQPTDPRALVVVVHGLAEHSGRYERTGRSFAKSELAAYAFDHRGHGKSPGRRVHVRSFEEFRADARAVLAMARTEYPGVPLFLLGHSQGGLVAATLALREPKGLAGLVLSSPFFGIAERGRPSPMLAGMARILAAVWPRALFPNGVDPALLSRDPAVGVAYAADPLVSRTVSAGWYRAAQQALAEVHANVPSLEVPTLVLYAGADALVDPEATARWVAHAPQERVEAFRYEGLYHEVLNAPEKEQVQGRIEDWIAIRTKQLGSARSAPGDS